jgi:Secretion system C-terminal sorting domain/Beta-propeller repeat
MEKNQLLKSVCIIALLAVISFPGLAQVNVNWAAVYGGPAFGGDWSSAMVVNHATGDVYVTGSITPPGGGSAEYYDYATVKYNKSGVRQWVATYNGPANDRDEANAICLDPSGNVYVTGSSIGVGTRDDFATIKYNPAGVVQWIKRFDGALSWRDRPKSIAADAAGNIYVAGGTGGTRPGDPGATVDKQDFVTIKYNPAGVQQWVAVYNGPDSKADYAHSLVLDNSANVYVTGSSKGVGTYYDYATIKYSSTGVQQWVARYSGPAGALTDDPKDLAVDALGNVYVTGKSQSTGGAYDYATVKYNNMGSLQWVSRYNGPANEDDNAGSVAVDGSGNVYVTGESKGVAGAVTNFDCTTIKYNAAGVEQWINRYNGPDNGNDGGVSLAIGPSGSIYIAGHTTRTATGANCLAIKYDASGVTKWLTEWNGSSSRDDRAIAIALPGSGYVYLLGSTYTGSTGFNIDYVTIQYSETAGRPGPVVSGTILPDRFRVSNYPNPASLTTKITYELPFDGNLSIDLYDILGKKITTLEDRIMRAGYYSKDVNVTTLQKGIYYYKVSLKGKEKTETRSGEMTVLK